MNNLPNNIWWHRVTTVGGDDLDTAGGTYPNLTMSHMPMTCQHCVTPACYSVCPTGATYKDEETGIVLIDYDTCIGCQSCIAACPYTGVRTYIESEPAYYMDFSTGEADAPVHQAQIVEKCTFCKNRLDRDGVPACMDLCPGRARFWGDFDDLASEVSQLIASREYERLMVEEGTEPSTYYLT
jgi:molybdopterin-containing oxidoreductase family iron-sulfur binding subunit